MPIQLKTNSNSTDSIVINGDNGGVGRVILGQGSNSYWGQYKGGTLVAQRLSFIGASNLPIDISSGGCDRYIMIINNLTATVSTASLNLQFSRNKGINYENTSYTTLSTQSQSSIPLYYNIGQSPGQNNIFSEIYLDIRNMNSGIHKPLISYKTMAHSYVYVDANDVIDSFRIYPSSGTISGRYALYGI